MIEVPTGFGFKRLLVGTDFSPRADVALRRAVQIAGEQGAALALFHACDADARDDARARKLMVEPRKLRARRSARFPCPTGLPRPFVSRRQAVLRTHPRSARGGK